LCFSFLCFFFFSSRRRHTRWPRDWSSDVCSSDLMRLACDRKNLVGPLFSPRFRIPGRAPIFWLVRDKIGDHFLFRGSVNTFTLRSEERRVGKECRSRWSP